MTRPEGLRVTKLARSPGGYWTANVSINGATIHADTSAGPWCKRRDRHPSEPCAAALAAGGSVREVLPAVRLELVRQQRRLERRQANERNIPTAEVQT